jgi:hypothetical protein
MKYSGKVLRDEEKSPGSKSVKNPHGRDNVNVAQGPRTGNNAEMGKRSAFKTAKEERAPLADMINKAFAMRGKMTNNETDPGLENISANTKAKFKR